MLFPNISICKEHVQNVINKNLLMNFISAEVWQETLLTVKYAPIIKRWKDNENLNVNVLIIKAGNVLSADTTNL